MAENRFLTETERATLRSVCDAFFPSLEPPPGAGVGDEAAYWRRCAADLGVADAVEETLLLETTPEQKRQIRLVLRALATPLIILLLTGSPTPFRDRSLLRREKLLRSWATGPLPPLRQAFLVFKRLSCFHFYAHTAPSGTNPNAALLGYPGYALPPPGPPANPVHPLRSLEIDRDTVLEADVCVIGSGAGGGPAAAVFAEAGRRVVVLEAGGYYTEADFDAQESSGWERLFMRRGALTTADGGIVLLAGRTLGGGTTVNWSTCFRPPRSLLEEWAARAGVPDLLGDELQASYDAVERRMNIHLEDRDLSPSNAALLEGVGALGLHAARNPRNVDGCGDCGICHFGCRWGGKQGTMRTYLQDAFDTGAQLVTDCRADRVLLEAGRVIGVEALVRPPVEKRDPGAPGLRLRVRAPLVVVAAGAIGSPTVLMRSGLRHRELGRNLYLHPSTAVVGRFDTPMRGWRGPIQAAYSDAFADLSGDGYGLRLEALPVYPGFAAANSPWEGARAFRETMRGLESLQLMLVLTRDRTSGRVVLDSQGGPQVIYRPGAESRKLMLLGVQEATRVALAAGASEVQTLHNAPLRISDPRQMPRFADAVMAAGAHPYNMLVGSAHQMGTCRMSADPARGVVDGTGAVHGVSGLYVFDTSIFPSASGVNPMETTLGLAHWLAMRAVSR
ncbi:MAG: GMC family oxidoreductase N-terminal domain-containing protein [Chloroflexia bacterium]